MSGTPSLGGNLPEGVMGLSLRRLILFSHGSFVLLLLVVIALSTWMSHHAEGFFEAELMRRRAEVLHRSSLQGLQNDESRNAAAVAQAGDAAGWEGVVRRDRWLLLGLGFVGTAFGMGVTWVTLRKIAEPPAALADLRRESDQLDQQVGEQATTVEMAFETLPDMPVTRETQHQPHIQTRMSKSAVRSAGDVAHDINNLLTVVNGCCYQLRQRVPDDPEAESLISAIEDVTDKTASCTRQLFNLDQCFDPDSSSVSLHEVKPDSSVEPFGAVTADRRVAPRSQEVAEGDRGASEPRKE